MSKLTKDQAAQHRRACALVDLQRELTWREREFVLEHWQESSTASNSLDGAFFTPLELARDMAVDVAGVRVLDLCAGAGRLAAAARHLNPWEAQAAGRPTRELVCVERNPEYVRVGRKVLPEARWVCADIFDLPDGLGRFDTVICNPPYGAVQRAGGGPAVRSRRFEYHALAVAAALGDYGVFLIPQESAPFRFSGEPYFREQRSADYERFECETGIRLAPGYTINTSSVRHQWRGVTPRTEVVTCDFTEARSLVHASSEHVGPAPRGDR
ncbi:methyltransferase [Streptacidiphilus sp. EB103A]|uniref:methyltransferase n=1 Tax=Streptacidiphilus sp. EB103A TaxID=3156275 RepID=UPI0035161F45